MITSKSPRKVLLVAYAAAGRALPAYAHRFSPKTFTQPQLLACLVLKAFLRLDYRGVGALLGDAPELCRVIALKKVPHLDLSRFPLPGNWPLSRPSAPSEIAAVLHLYHTMAVGVVLFQSRGSTCPST